MRKKGLLASVLLPALVLVIALTTITPSKVMANGLTDDKDKQFDVELLLTSSAKWQYELQVSVTNNGEDFDGYVRIVPESNYDKCAYDKEIVLAKGTTKQYNVLIPSSGLRSARAKCTVVVEDKKGKIIQEEVVSNVFTYGDTTLAVGVLSDDMNSLAYMDMGGAPVYIQQELYTLKLSQLQPADLLDNLDAYKVLLIDQFDTSSLTDDEVQAIFDWVDAGGTLILGTGLYAHEVVDSLADRGNLKVEVLYTYDQSTGTPYVNYGGFSEAVLEVVNDTELVVTLCDNANNGYDFYETYEMAGIAASRGDGSVNILYFSFADPYFKSGAISQDVLSEFIEGVLVTATDGSSSWYLGYSSTDLYYEITSLFDKINSNMADVHMGLLFALILVYVIFVGPVLYFILRAKKKQNVYWVAVPAAAVAMILLLGVISRFYTVSKYTGASVTVADASGNGMAETFLMAYSSGNRPWTHKVIDDTHYVQESSYSYDYSDDYKNRIIDGNDGWYVGGRPSRSFDEMYYLLTRDNHASGVFTSNGVSLDDYGRLDGVLTNNTGRDMDFVLLTDGEWVCIVKDVPNGTQIDYTQHTADNDYYNKYKDPNIDQYVYYVIHNAFYDYYDEGTKEDVDELSALYFGLMECYAKGDLVAIGVTSDYEKVLADDANEAAYGCLYTVLK